MTTSTRRLLTVAFLLALMRYPVSYTLDRYFKSVPVPEVSSAPTPVKRRICPLCQKTGGYGWDGDHHSPKTWHCAKCKVFGDRADYHRLKKDEPYRLKLLDAVQWRLVSKPPRYRYELDKYQGDGKLELASD